MSRYRSRLNPRSWAKSRLTLTIGVLLVVAASILLLSRGSRRQAAIPGIVWQLDSLIIHGTHQQAYYRQLEMRGQIEVGSHSYAPQIQIIGDRGKEIRGHDGCNAFHGPVDYWPSSGRLEIAGIQQLLLGCELTRGKFVGDEFVAERVYRTDIILVGVRFLEALPRSVRYELNEGELLLYSPEGEQVLIFIPSSEPLRYQKFPRYWMPND